MPTPDGDAAVIRSDEVLRIFSEYADRPFVFIRPGGNAGDRLIYLGAEKVARSVDLTFVTVTHEEFLAGRYDREVVLYLHGGGGYNPLWSGKPMVALEKAVRHRGVVVQGPQTFWDDLDFLRRRIGVVVGDAACERLFVLTRERKSAELMRQVLPASVEVLQDHDTALNLAASDFPKLSTLDYVFYAIREDKEALPVVAREYSAVWGDPVALARDFDEWFTLHARATSIVTNRLHSSILGAILGIPTTLCPNSYFKNRAVWEHSLESLGIAWADEVPVSAVSRALHQIAPVRRLLSSRWVNGRVRRALGLGF